MSASVRGRRGGTPSTTAPIAGPWLSPQVVNRKAVPKLFPAMISALVRAAGETLKKLSRLRRRIHRDHADGVIAGIDVMDFTRDATAQIAQQVEGRAADFADRDVAPKWR